MTGPEMSLVSSTISNRIVDIRDQSGPPQPPVAWPEGREGAAKQTFTILARILDRQEIGPLARQALEGRLKHSAKQVFDAIVESGGKLSGVVVSLLKERWSPDIADELLVLCDDAHYSESVPLMEIALVATRQVFELRRIWKSDGTRSLIVTMGEGLPPLTSALLGKAELARVANNLGARLLAVHRDQEAREALDMALTFRSELADLRPDLYSARLADTQLNLANLEGPQEALPRIREAVEIYERLAADKPTPGLVRASTQASDVLRSLGRYEKALAAACQAVSRSQHLDTAGPENASIRAEALIALGAAFGACGHLTETHSAYGQAVTLLRELNKLQPDQARPHLARSVFGQSAAALALQQGQQALDLAKEAISLQRKLAEIRPDIYLPELARGLNRLSDLLRTQGYSDKAASIREEAERIVSGAYAPENRVK